MWFLEQFGGRGGKQRIAATVASPDSSILGSKDTRGSRFGKQLAWILLFVAYPVDLVLLANECRLMEMNAHNNRKSAIVNRDLVISLSLFALAACALEMSSAKTVLRRIQKRWALRARQSLGFVGSNADYAEERWPETSRINYCFLISIISGFALTRFAHGQDSMLTLEAVKFMLYGTAAVVLGAERSVLFSHYLLVPFQMMTLRLVPNDSSMMRFALFSRGLLSFHFIDLLPRMLVLQIPVMFLSGDAIKPCLVCLANIFLMDVIGFREIMCAWSDDRIKASRPTQNRGAVAGDNGYVTEKGIVLIATIAFVYILTAAYNPILHKNVQTGRAAPTLMIVSACFTVLSFLGRRAIRNMFALTLAKEEVGSQEQSISTNMFLSFCVTAGVVAAHFPPWFAILVLAYCILSLLLVTFALERSRGDVAWRALLVLHGLVIVAGFLMHGPLVTRNFQLPILLTIARCVVVVERPAYCFWTGFGLSSLSTLTLACMYMSGVESPSVAFNVASVSITAGFLVSVFAAFREGKLHLIAIAGKSGQFLDHAVKQKYAAVGCTLEQLLEIRGLRREAPELYETARAALNECLIGRDICHLSAFTHKLLIDPQLAKSCQVLNLRSVLGSWHSLVLFRKIEVDALNDSAWTDACFRFDEDILQALLCSMSSDPERRVLHVQIVPGETLNDLLSPLHESSRAYVVFRCTMRQSKHSPAGLKRSTSTMASDERMDAQVNYLRRKVCEAFNATISGQTLIIPLISGGSKSATYGRHSAGSEEQTSVYLSAESVVESPDNSGSTLSLLPAGLTFAILDDVKIMRISLLKMCLENALGDARTSFSAGASFEGALLFPQSITSKSVDIVIVDENLEYPDRLLSGTQIAKSVRAKGFKRCLVLHSANADLKDTLDPCFDGFVEKTSKREEFLRGLMRAWARYCQRADREDHSG